MKFSSGNGNNQTIYFAFNTILDSGSPISIIKNSFVPNLRAPVNDTHNVFQGINGSRLKISGIFEREVIIEGITIKIKFYIVPDETMNFTALLGRDFFTHPSINVTLSDRIIISQRNDEFVPTSENEIRDLMHIEYLNAPEDVGKNLQINSEIYFETAEKMRSLFKNNYEKFKEKDIDEINFEMQISLTYSQPISFRPRRLSFADKEKLRDILDDLINRGIIQTSSLPYASPIVLTIKKLSG